MCSSSFLLRLRLTKSLTLVALIAVPLIVLLTFYRGLTPHAYAEANHPDAPGSISGLVTDGAGASLAGIEVSLYQEYAQYSQHYPIRTVTTQADGRYRFSLLPAGRYSIGFADPMNIYGDRYWPNAHRVSDAEEIAISGNNVETIDIQLQPGGTIAGTITAATGITLTYRQAYLFQLVDDQVTPQWVTFDSVSLSADEAKFQFAGLSPDRYRLCAQGSDLLSRTFYECYDNVYELETAATLTVTAGTVLSQTNIVFGDGADFAQITGTVTAANGEPLADMAVAAFRADHVAPSQATAQQTPYAARPLHTDNSPISYVPYAKTDQEGRYHLASLPAGSYILYYEDPAGDFAYEYYADALITRDSTAISVDKGQVVTDVNVVLQPAAHITGTLTIVGQPAPSGWLAAYIKLDDILYNIPLSTRSDPQTGHYNLGGLPAGTYRIQASASVHNINDSYYYHGFYGGNNVNNATDVAVAEGTRRTGIDIDLTDGAHFEGAISGQVTAEGRPRENIQVFLHHTRACCGQQRNPPFPEPPLTYVYTDEDGRYKFDGLTYGSYSLSVRDPSGIYAQTFYPNEPILKQPNWFVVEDNTALAEMNINLARGGAIQGTVQGRDGAPVANLNVFAGFVDEDRLSHVVRITKTAADGTYTVAGLYAGTYRICFGEFYGNSPGYLESVKCYGAVGRDQTIYSGVEINVTAGSTLSNIDIAWGSDYIIYLPTISQQ